MRRHRALILGCWLALAALAPAASAAASPPPVADSLRHALDAAWKDRTTPAAATRMRALATDARIHLGRDFGTSWRAARALWWLAHVEDDRARRAALAHEAAAAAEHAIALRPDRVEGHFAYAAAIGEYGASIGAAQAVWEGVAPKFERAALAAYARDRDFEDGGPMLALGRYYFALPWPLRDLAKSRRYLEELTARHPDALLGRVWLAETLLALGDADAARTVLESVAHAEHAAPVRLAGYTPKRMAREMLDELPPLHANAGRPAPRS